MALASAYLVAKCLGRVCRRFDNIAVSRSQSSDRDGIDELLGGNVHEAGGEIYDGSTSIASITTLNFLEMSVSNL